MKNRSKDKFFEPPIAGFRRRSAWGKIPGVPIRRLHLSYRFDLSQDRFAGRGRFVAEADAEA